MRKYFSENWFENFHFYEKLLKLTLQIYRKTFHNFQSKLEVKLQYTTPWRFCVDSTRLAPSANNPKQTQSTNKPIIQTQNTKGFRSPCLQFSQVRILQITEILHFFGNVLFSKSY